MRLVDADVRPRSMAGLFSVEGADLASSPPPDTALKTSVSISWHLGHSKVRSSRPSSIGVTLIIFICAPHCRQAGIKRRCGG